MSALQAMHSSSNQAFDLSGLTLVVGLGKSGLSAVRTLVALGADVAVTDSRKEPPAMATLAQEFPGLPSYLGYFDPALFERAARLIISPGISVQTPVIAAAAASGVPVWGDIELFARLNRVPVAAITGSNGKSTVTTLLGEMAKQSGLRASVGGNLGTPALDLLYAAQANPPDIYILELSSFQLETTYSLNARVATILNISPDHLDRYNGLEDYKQAKQRVFRGDGCMIINADDAAVSAMVEPGRPLLRFTLAEPEPDEFGLRRRGDETWLACGDDDWLAASRLKISGAHNLANALAALAMGQALGLQRAAMLEALVSFGGLPHRSQLVAEGAGVRWFNDSKATNVGATVAAVRGMPGCLVVIAGGEGKGQDFTPLRAAFQDKVRALILIGRDAPLINAAIAGTTPTYQASDLDQAVQLAARLARAGDNVLLSPACASFDMFNNYEERGAVFAAAARRQTQEGSW